MCDSASDQDTATSSETTSEDEGDLQDVAGVTHLQPDLPPSSGQASSSSIGTNASECIQTGSDQQWTLPSGPQTDVVHIFTGGERGLKKL